MKKIIIISLLLIVLASTVYNSFAFEIGEKDLKLLRICEAYLKYMGNEKKVPIVVYKNGDNIYPAYCLNPEYTGIGTNGMQEYSVDFSKKIEGENVWDENVWRAIINGYPYKSLEELGVDNIDEAYTATKFAVYTLKENRNVADYEAVDTEAGRRTLQAYLKIVENARNSNETLKDNNKISVLPISEEWKVDEQNNSFVSKIYKINTKLTNGNFEVKINGILPEGSILTDEQNNLRNSFKINEKFKILIPIDKLKENINFSINVKADLETKPVVYGKTNIPETQNYAIAGYMNEPSETNYEENCLKNITKIRIIKKEYGSEKRLKDVKFNLLDLNKNVIKENLITDENGEIIIDELFPGKYYIQETETLEGYNLYKDLIPVDIKFNEEIEIIVNNTTKSKSEITNEVNTIQVLQKETETKNTITKKLPVTGC